MIIVIVEHFLNDEGRGFFPEWIKQVEVIVSTFEGYISLQQIKNVEAQDRSFLELRFENLDLLRKWAKSEAHDQAIEKLAPYRLKKQRSQVFEYL